MKTMEQLRREYYAAKNEQDQAWRTYARLEDAANKYRLDQPFLQAAKAAEDAWFESTKRTYAARERYDEARREAAHKEALLLEAGL